MKNDNHQNEVLEIAFNDVEAGVKYLKSKGAKLRKKTLANVIEIIKSDLDQIEKIYNH